MIPSNGDNKIEQRVSAVSTGAFGCLKPFPRSHICPVYAFTVAYIINIEFTLVGVRNRHLMFTDCHHHLPSSLRGAMLHNCNIHIYNMHCIVLWDG